MLISIAATLASLVILAWAADRFVTAAAALARYLGMSPLLIAMLVIGFGTSAPEVMIAAQSSLDGNPDLALGTAFGSNIVNIGLVLGIAALATPIMVQRGVVRREFPVLLGVTALVWILLLDGYLSRVDALVFLGVLLGVGVLAVWYGRRKPEDPLAAEVEVEIAAHPMSRRAAWLWVLGGLVILVAASRLLVWGAVGIAQHLGWSELVIGLTVVAIGTSTPELASAIIAARKGEGDIVLGNIVGSNIFNALAVVGVAGVIAPTALSPVILSRDIPVMAAFTVALVVFGLRLRGRGRINRWEGGALLLALLAYTAYLFAAGV